MKPQKIKTSNWKTNKDIVTHIIWDSVEKFSTDKCKRKYNTGNPINVITINLN